MRTRVGKALTIAEVICGPDTRNSRKRGSRGRCVRPVFVTPAHPSRVIRSKEAVEDSSSGVRSVICV
jgi:hypothetical protein